MRGNTQIPRSGAHRIAAVLAAAVLLGGCSRPDYPEYQLNPTPKDAREVVIKLNNAPAGLEVSEAYASYRIVNQTCLPKVTNLQGVQSAPKTHTVRRPLRKVDDSTTHSPCISTRWPFGTTTAGVNAGGSSVTQVAHPVSPTPQTMSTSRSRAIFPTCSAMVETLTSTP